MTHLAAIEELRRSETVAALKTGAANHPTKSDVIRVAVMEALKRAKAVTAGRLHLAVAQWEAS